MEDIKIKYENKNIIVLIKPGGVLSETGKNGIKCIQDFFKFPIYCVHRLDREVSGIMIYAKNKETAAILNHQIQAGEFHKEYIAVVHGRPEKGSGIYEDLLFKDSKRNKVYVVDRERKGVKKARLEYKILKTNEELTEIFVKLYTGRTHQIRVQFASRKMPVYGDKKYGGRDSGGIALFSYRIEFKDNKGKIISFKEAPPEIFPYNLKKST